MNQPHVISASRGVRAIPGHGPGDLSKCWGTTGHALWR